MSLPVGNARAVGTELGGEMQAGGDARTHAETMQARGKPEQHTGNKQRLVKIVHRIKVAPESATADCAESRASTPSVEPPPGGFESPPALPFEHDLFDPLQIPA